MNKSLLTNLLSILLIITGYYSPVYRDQILSVGFFALSGAFTNWIAVYMLFDRIPFVYGSGVIPNQFEEFKKGIKHLIMSEFFTDENVDAFFKGKGQSKSLKIDFAPVVEAIDFNQIYDGLLEMIAASNLGQMLQMVGGVAVLEPMRPKFVVKIKATVIELTKTDQFLTALENNVLPSHLSQNVTQQIEQIVDERLNELTPKMVKDIIQTMIRQHLGWLVVWGGVFGGMIGLIMSYINL